MIDFNYTAPELLPFRIQEVLDAPNEPHRIGGVVYVPEGGGECKRVKRGTKPDGTPRYRCSVCGYGLGDHRWAYCPNCRREVVDA